MLSLIPIGTSLAQAAILSLLNPVFIRPRFIAGFIADITVEEHHIDETVVTEHPVENGASITDHCYLRPSVVTIRCGYSNSSPRSFGNPNYVQQVYQAFLALRAARSPFDVMTGKRFYRNMLMTSLRTDTDERTEFATFFQVECRELLLVNTQTVMIPPASSMKTPELNQPTQNNGVKQLGSAPDYQGAVSFQQAQQ